MRQEHRDTARRTTFDDMGNLIRMTFEESHKGIPKQPSARDIANCIGRKPTISRKHVMDEEKPAAKSFAVRIIEREQQEKE